MGIEQLAVDMAKLDEMKPKTSEKPVFLDSDRGLGGELPPIDSLIIEENLVPYEGQFYPDSNRDLSEGPLWDEEEFQTEGDFIEELSGNSLDEADTVDESSSGNQNDKSYETQEKNELDETDSPEYNEDGTRELIEEEKQELKEKLSWSDDKLKKCTIDENEVIQYKTDRCDLEGKTSGNGVPYERRTIEINGVKIEGVFPQFDSAFDTELDPDSFKSKAYAKECNVKLKEAIEDNPELKCTYTEEQLKDIEEGRTPIGYVWHHNEEPGKMQLVTRKDHDRVIGGAAHTGGNSLWGVDSVDNSKKGENF